MASNSKQYGLILPQKANQGLVRNRPSIFNDSESEEEKGGAIDWVKKAMKRESDKTFQKKKQQVDMQKALAEDPTVYQYDEVYDKIEEKKAEIKNVKKMDKKPRYIQSLLLQAEKRKRENERRNERIIQKEREAEGDEFKDKEAFVTSAYRQKLEEFKKMDEEERRQDAIEAITDVSKQKDLSGFYRHLYRQTVVGQEESATIKQEKDESSGKVVEQSSEVQSEEIGAEKAEQVTESNKSPHEIEDATRKSSGRHYRKRQSASASSDSGEDSEGKGTSKSKTTENPDADSDFSDSSDSSESGSESSSKGEGERKEKKSSSDQSAQNNKPDVKVNEQSSEHSRKRKSEEKGEETKKKMKEEVPDCKATQEKPKEKEKKEVKPKINIWVKRTVGDVFEAALQRYFQRKAERLTNRG